MQHFMKGSTVLAINGLLWDFAFLSASLWLCWVFLTGGICFHVLRLPFASTSSSSITRGWKEGWSKARFLVSNGIILDEVSATFCAALFQQWRMYCLHAKGSCELDKLNRWKLMWLRCSLYFWVCRKLKRNDLLRFYCLRRSVIRPFLLSAWVQEWQKQHLFSKQDILQLYRCATCLTIFLYCTFFHSVCLFLALLYDLTWKYLSKIVTNAGIMYILTFFSFCSWFITLPQEESYNNPYH